MIPVNPVSQTIPVSQVIPLSPVSPVSPVRLAHLWVDFRVITSEMALDALFASVIHFTMIERLKNSAGHLVGTSPDVQ